eukprot:GFYU01014468.1.p1 GENE.GFYU01014468.1~~GFYU01014468.1.p1  ORF type:complete len:120 (-),score=18.43 GFYU01014468.1:54-413(-)
MGFRGHDREGTQMEYLLQARKLPHFGAALFNVKAAEPKPGMPEKIILAIYDDSVALLSDDRERRAITTNHRHVDIVRGEKNLQLLSQDGAVLELQTEQVTAISDFIIRIVDAMEDSDTR